MKNNTKVSIPALAYVLCIVTLTVDILLYLRFNDYTTAIYFIELVGILLAMYFLAAMREAEQWEKAVILRLGKFIGLKGPGLFLMIPIIDRVYSYIDQRLRVTDIVAESTLTKDTVPITVDAVVYWTVVNSRIKLNSIPAFF